MIDIPSFIEQKRKDQATEYFMQLRLSLAANNRIMEDDDYKNFIRNLTKNLNDEKETDQVTDANKLDRHALEALRLMTNMGANKTGGR